MAEPRQSRPVARPDQHLCGNWLSGSTAPIPPKEPAITRLVGTILLEQNEEWCVQRSRHVSLESLVGLSDNPVVSLPIMAA